MARVRYLYPSEVEQFDPSWDYEGSSPTHGWYVIHDDHPDHPRIDGPYSRPVARYVAGEWKPRVLP